MTYLDEKKELNSDIYEIRKNGLFEKDCQNIAEVIAYGIEQLPEFLSPLRIEHRRLVLQSIIDRLIREKDKHVPDVRKVIENLKN